MAIPVTINLLENKHTSDFEELASMNLIDQKDNCSLIVLSYDAKNIPANLINQLREGCKDSNTYHIIRTDKTDPPRTDNQTHYWLKDECLCSRDEYLLREINDAKCTLTLELKGDH
jgi:hypothetical protein